MNSKAQAGLEYLMTYGWALVLITAAIAILVFIVSSPSQEITFSSSDPTKIMLSSGAMQGISAVAMLKNTTGGRILITDISPTGDSYSACTINEESANIDVPAGGTMELNCPLSGEDPTGAVTITYDDYAGLQRTAVISVSGGSAGPPCESGGTGTQEDPYILTTIAELQAIPDSSTSYYELCQNIDASATSGWDDGKGFAPITNFGGYFDGKGNKITGLYINRNPSGSWVSLFGSMTASGVISNLGLENVNLTGATGYCAAFVGYNYGTISNCYATGGSITSSAEHVGGLVAANNGGGVITNSYSTVAVSNGGTNVGGFVGANGGTCTNGFWDTQTSGQATSPCGTGKTTADMKLQATFTGWDFTTVWNINEGTSYPFLR